MSGPNTSTAVMARRKEPHDSLDYFPTPPWATRALLVHCAEDAKGSVIWEPACGDGHMARPLSEYASQLIASDVHDYGWGHHVHDFLMPFLPHGVDRADWIITNPPFRLAEQFVHRGLEIAERGVAVIVRTAFAESIQRYESLFRDRRPSMVAQFVERVPMVKGRVDEDAASATAYCWMVWDKLGSEHTRMIWIPPCRSRLERPGDYAALEQTAEQ